jgi:hypothetical protein
MSSVCIQIATNRIKLEVAKSLKNDPNLRMTNNIPPKADIRCGKAQRQFSLLGGVPCAAAPPQFSSQVTDKNGPLRILPECSVAAMQLPRSRR